MAEALASQNIAGRSTAAKPRQPTDEPLNLAASPKDEELPFVRSTPKATAIAEPGEPADLEKLNEGLSRDGGSE